MFVCACFCVMMNASYANELSHGKGEAASPERYREADSLHANSLSGESIEIPRGLTAETSVLFVAFSKKSGPLVVAWENALQDKLGSMQSSPQPSVIIISVLAEAPRLIRRFIVKAIKSDTPKEKWNQYHVAVDDLDAWRRLVDYEEKEHVYVLVYDQQVRRLLRVSGAVSERKISDVMVAISNE